MMETIVGRDAFGEGLRLYLSRHDGTGSTIEEFVECLAECSDCALSQFVASWYSQPGTPSVAVSTAFDAERRTFTVEMVQSNPMLEGRPWTPYLIPLRLRLLSRKMDHQHTAPFELMLDSEAKHGPISRTLLMAEREQKWTFHHIEHEPLLSLNRYFSAPVYVQVLKLTLLAEHVVPSHDA